MSVPKYVELHPGYKGFVGGVVNADYKQRAFVELRDADGVPLSYVIFEGRGRRVPMKIVRSRKEYSSFGPFNFAATATIIITHSDGDGRFRASNMVGPLSIDKKPEPDYPMPFYQSTVISEDGEDQSHDDCTLTVLQYRDTTNPCEEAS